MSRLIVKNLPKRIKENKLRELFGAHGTLTDCTLKYTRDGFFRRFAFIGYKTEEEAKTAQSYLDKTFINTDQIEVSIATTVNDEEKPRAWSKYSQDSSAFQRKEKSDPAYIERVKKEYEEMIKKERSGRINDLLGDLKDDDGFQEFLKLHDSADKRPIWTNDTTEAGATSVKNTANTTQSQEVKSSTDMEVDESSKNTASPKKSKKQKSIKEEPDKLSKTNISDMDYLKSKMSKTSSDEIESENESDEDEDVTESTENVSGGETVGEKRELPGSTHEKRYAVSIKGLKGAYGANTIIQFFQPLKVGKIDISKSEGGVNTGTAYVDFFTEKDMDQAQRRSKTFINGKKVIVRKLGEKMVEVKAKAPRPWEVKHYKTTEDEEGIAESGRLFVRNLAYSCTEEEVEGLFKKFGPLTEVSLQVDRLMNKPKGFALVTYMMPEHAVVAYTQLDGSIFQGRMLHILPGKEKKEYEDAEGLTFKKKKELQQKKMAKSSHNWNTLFLGSNAVADVMAEKYGTTKSNILDADSKGNIGVRMALGETQIVSETREFLLQNGVSLDSFSQANAPRSKTVIIAKNLPAGSKVLELRKLFEKFGAVGRLLLPPSGISAVIEFLEPNDAKIAFTKLAYSKFRHLPLYLEWAPVEVFSGTPTTKPSEEKKEDGSDERVPENNENNQENEDSDEEPEEDATLFVKNLSFETKDADLKGVFEKCGKIVKANVAKKMDIRNPGKHLSMGFGFVQFKYKSSLEKALKDLQKVELQGHSLELKRSNRVTQTSDVKQRKKQKEKKPTTKILVRNIPFEVKVHELAELFKVFGEIKFVRLPKKLSGTGTHRGFGFVDFMSKEDAKRAFNALCHSTHLYGRRLVLEWADTEESIDDLRRKVALSFHDEPQEKKLKRSNLVKQLQKNG